MTENKDGGLRLQDTFWGVFRTLNAVIHSAQLHQTMATNDGTQIERLPCACTQPEGIGYLVGTVCCGQSNFVNY